MNLKKSPIKIRCQIAQSLTQFYARVKSHLTPPAIAFSVYGACLLFSTSAQALTTINVSTETELRNAIFQASNDFAVAGGFDGTGSGADGGSYAVSGGTTTFAGRVPYPAMLSGQ